MPDTKEVQCLTQRKFSKSVITFMTHYNNCHLCCPLAWESSAWATQPTAIACSSQQWKLKMHSIFLNSKKQLKSVWEHNENRQFKKKYNSLKSLLLPLPLLFNKSLQTKWYKTTTIKKTKTKNYSWGLYFLPKFVYFTSA